jgi:hypothetical protein
MQALDLTASYLRSQDYRPIIAGDNYNLKLTLTEKDISDTITAIDLTAPAKVWLTVKRSTDDGDAGALLQLSSASAAEIEITDHANGKITIKFTPAGTAGIPGLWPYDIQVKKTDGGLVTVAGGQIEFGAHTTRATS